MKPLLAFSPLVWLGLFTVSAGLSRSQTIAEALDSPAFPWTPFGAVAPLADPALSHDGVDVVRINATTSADPWPSVKTTVTVPSVVEFWHRSQDLAAMTTLGRDAQPAAISSSWKKVRWVQWTETPATSGELEISNRGVQGKGPLFVDEISITPAIQVSLAEALDFPGLIGSGYAALGLAEPWLSPDGVDAAVFAHNGSYVEATLPGPGLVQFRHAGGDIEPSVHLTTSGGAGLPALVLGDTSWAWVRSGGDYRFSAKLPTYQPSLRSQVPIVLDALETPAKVTINEALDAPGLVFSVTGIVAGAAAPPGAPDDDAVLCLQRTEGIDQESGITLTVSGPGIVRFSYVGGVSVKRTGQAASDGGTSATWQTLEVPVYRSGERLTWSTWGSGFWLTAVSVLPPTPDTSVAGLLNAPDLIPEVLVPAYLGATPGSIAGDPALEVTPLTPVPLQPVLRLPFSGASLVSLEVSDYSRTARVRIDGGGWQTVDHTGQEPFRAVVPGGGPHALEITGPVVLDRFHVMPLTEVSLAEALDAPGMTFSTSPERPWSGYAVPAGAGWKGDHAAFGGTHATAGDPWIETQVTGPGILRSSPKLHAAGAEGEFSPPRSPSLLIDGVPASPWMAPAEMLLPAGAHTARWVQKGSQVQNASGTLASLDAVSFEPLVPISLGAALETPDRAWTAGGVGRITPVSWATHSPDGVDSVHIETDPAADAAWLETVVNLPCHVSFHGKSIQVSIGNGPGLFQLSAQNFSSSNPNSFNSLRKFIPGSGPARVRFTATLPHAVLDAVDFEQPDGRLLSSVTLGTPELTWKLYGDQPWQVVPREATGSDRYRARLNEKVWMETVVTGPGRLFVPSATLPDHDNRLTDFGWIPYAGPQRVLVGRPADSLLSTMNFQPSPPIEWWAGAPDLTWTTGGDVPWQSTFDAGVRSGLVWPGEVSWIEAALTGPGVLFWDSSIAGSGVGVLREVTCDGMAMLASASRGWLHLGAGAHRIRWSMANPRDGTRNDTGVLTLKNVAFTPQPDQSVSSVLSAGALNFHEIPPPNSSGPEVAAPLPWPSPSGWQIVNDTTLPGPAVHGDFNSGSLTAFLPAPGRLTSLLKMEGSTPFGAAIPASGLVAAAAPFPWLPWASAAASPSAAAFPRGDGVQTFVAQPAFVPNASVSVAEALDQPDLTWTAGSTPPGLWQPLTDLSSPLADPDALHLVRAAMGDRAWLETTVTGPLRVTTTFDRVRTATDAGIRLLVDNVLVVDDTFSRFSTSHVNVPSGVHRVRWEIVPSQPISTFSEIAIRSITTTAAAAHPDVPELLDAPGLEWASTGTGAMIALSAGTHDGVDALGLAGNRLVAGLTGPGILSFWIKAPSSSNGITLDSVDVPLTSGSSSTWVRYTLPIPQGRHSVSISGSNTTALDEFSFQPLPALSAEAALDAPAGVTVSIPVPENVGAAAYPGLSDDGTDSLLLMPGAYRRISLHVPPLSSLSLRVRSAFGTGSFGFQDFPSEATTTTWTTRRFSTPTEGGLTTIFLRARSVPVLLDTLIVTTPPATSQYFPWAAAAGLSVSQQDTSADPDHDGLSNFAEYAHGLDPTVPDLFRTGTDTVPGLPEVSTFTATDGSMFLEVRYWRRSLLAATVETATHPSGAVLLGDPAGWDTATNPPTSTDHPDGWVRLVWRSPTSIAPGTQQFARVRTYLP